MGAALEHDQQDILREALHLFDSIPNGTARLVTAHGQEVKIVPAEVVELIKVLIHEKVVEAENDEISPNEAAEILRVSRPTVVRMCKKGLLKFYMVGAHHRLSRKEVEIYAKTQLTRRQEVLEKLTCLSQEFDGIFGRNSK